MRYLIWVLLIYIAYRVVVKLVSGRGGQVKRDTEVETAAATHQDPVCGMYVPEDDAVIGRLEGKRYYFCSKECLEKFQEKIENRKG